MTDNCANCGEKIHDGGMFASPNYRVPDKDIKIVNQVLKTAYSELCNHCGKKIVEDSIGVLRNEMESCQSYFQDHITDFPMMTISQAPVNAKCRIKAMVTANVSVGTGIFNELSQGFSDMFGATNTTSGMAHKINITRGCNTGVT